MNPIIISIDGNIGAGKSTFLKYLRDNFPNVHFIDEPVDSWTGFKNEKGESLLEVYYKDKSRWSFTFQNCALMTRYLNILKNITDWWIECKIDPEKIKNNIFITERFFDTDFNIFAQMLHDDGFINEMEWSIYKQWYDHLNNQFKLNGVIYIHCLPDKCKERIIKRNRSGENEILTAYLEKVHFYHEKWMNETFIPTLKIDTNEDIEFKDFASLKQFLENF